MTKRSRTAEPLSRHAGQASLGGGICAIESDRAGFPTTGVNRVNAPSVHERGRPKAPVVALTSPNGNWGIGIRMNSNSIHHSYMRITHAPGAAGRLSRTKTAELSAVHPRFRPHNGYLNSAMSMCPRYDNNAITLVIEANSAKMNAARSFDWAAKPSG
jgi:hypothetical protein